MESEAFITTVTNAVRSFDSRLNLTGFGLRYANRNSLTSFTLRTVKTHPRLLSNWTNAGSTTRKSTNASHATNRSEDSVNLVKRKTQDLDLLFLK